jgi:hypothetical protein
MKERDGADGSDGSGGSSGGSSGGAINEGLLEEERFAERLIDDWNAAGRPSDAQAARRVQQRLFSRTVASTFAPRWAIASGATVLAAAVGAFALVRTRPGADRGEDASGALVLKEESRIKGGTLDLVPLSVFAVPVDPDGRPVGLGGPEVTLSPGGEVAFQVTVPSSGVMRALVREEGAAVRWLGTPRDLLPGDIGSTLFLETSGGRLLFSLDSQTARVCAFLDPAPELSSSTLLDELWARVDHEGCAVVSRVLTP